jgi:hypothetical protein
MSGWLASARGKEMLTAFIWMAFLIDSMPMSRGLVPFGPESV